MNLSFRYSAVTWRKFGLRLNITPALSFNRKMSSYETLNTSFVKPVLDDRNYRYIQLPNKLKALVIQDKDADKAAAALDVNVGAFEDPENLPGLAHFCEHLLFMGSSKFPNENEYSSFLSKHGGSSNAYTGSQNTNYFFQVNHENLKGALDRFSGFFTCPLFNKDSTDKEINAVDSENKKNLQSDLWRLYQLDKSLTNPEHPFHKFSTGNIKTLGEIPKSENIDIRDELLKFYDSSYSANIMKLCILGREDLDTLSQWVFELFKDVANKDRPAPHYPAQMLKPENLTKIVYAKPVKNLRKLEVTFTVPDMDLHWDSQPQHVLSHLIGHEGSGSLLAYLKTKGWANELSAGGHTVSKDNACFSVDVDLTDEGIKNYKRVVHLIFQYIQLLKNELPQEWIHTELRDIAEANFRYKQKENPASTVSAMAKLMEKEFIPVENILSTSLMRKHDPSLVVDYVKHLTPENSRVCLVHKGVETDQKEKWYGTEYKIEEYPEDLKKLLSDPGLNSHMHLPRHNEFICTHFDVEKLNTVEPQPEPKLLKSDDQCKLWYKKDDRFWVPKGHIYISIKLAHTHSSAVNSMLTSLYVELVNDYLKDLEYDAQVASLHVSFRKTNQGLDLSLSGFNEKLAILLTRFLEGISAFRPTESRFKIFKDKLTQKLENHLYEVPYAQVSDVYNSLINDRSWPVREKVAVLQQLTFQHLQNFIPTIYEQLFYETLVHGNFNRDVAFEINDLVKILTSNSIKNLQVRNARLRSHVLPEGKEFRYEVSLADSNNVNSCIQHVIQLGVYSEELSAKAAFLAQLIDEPAFNTLRTKEQLGYVVFSSALSTHGSVNMRILIQSERSTYYLESRIDAFLKSFGEKLANMSEEELNRHKTALCKTMVQRFKNLDEEHSRFATSIYMGDYNFQNKERRAALVEKLSKSDILEVYHKLVDRKVLPRLVVHLKSQIQPSKEQDKESPEGYPSGQLITDIGDFKSQLYLGPVRQPVPRPEALAKL
ncbi:LAMI_0A02542g1_1 [Lachancea mirantina]|uniref:LAMI_0A02542g1_1 n=1 Tax=Lachancea mirantina TaxID=1230905 RepID=A0A1G4IN47_9SACH|nr:LAMI_0A02542g1_1 [Lachancea mirantina]